MPEPKLIRRPMRWERDFVQLPNRWMRDSRLSYRARGLLAMLMTQKPGWNVTLRALASESPNEGIDALRSAVVELERLGYLTRHPTTHRGRFTGDDWELSDPWDAVDNPLPTALDDPTRSPVDNSHRVGSSNANRTLIPVETKESQPQRRAGGWRPCGEPGHVYVPGGSWCERCGLRTDGTAWMDFPVGIVHPLAGGGAHG